MEKSKQVERIAIKIQESLQMWETIGGDKETKQEYEIKQSPEMYHPTDDLVKIPIYTDGTKIIITIEKVDPYTIENTEDKIYTKRADEERLNEKFENFGYPSKGTKCEKVECLVKDTRSEPRFGYSVCKHHMHLSPIFLSHQKDGDGKDN